jgi:hypothetical protein
VFNRFLFKVHIHVGKYVIAFAKSILSKTCFRHFTAHQLVDSRTPPSTSTNASTNSTTPSSTPSPPPTKCSGPCPRSPRCPPPPSENWRLGQRLASWAAPGPTSQLISRPECQGNIHCPRVSWKLGVGGKFTFVKFVKFSKQLSTF